LSSTAQKLIEKPDEFRLYQFSRPSLHARLPKASPIPACNAARVWPGSSLVSSVSRLRGGPHCCQTNLGHVVP
jgi:hypothetical protein